MAEFTFADLLTSAGDAPKSGGGFAPELDAPGTYNAVVSVAKKDETSGGKLRIGIKFVVEDGPKQGHAIWGNQILSPESPAALDIFFRTFEALGIPRDAWAKYGSQVDVAGEAVCAAIDGTRAQIKVAMGKPNNGYAAKLEVKFVNPAKGTAPAAASAPAAPAAPAAPQIPQQAAAPTLPAAPPRSPF